MKSSVKVTIGLQTHKEHKLFTVERKISINQLY